MVEPGIKGFWYQVGGDDNGSPEGQVWAGRTAAAAAAAAAVLLSMQQCSR
jgi:hypothetical protein